MARKQLGAITSGTNDDITAGGAQTLTNKIITSPRINTIKDTNGNNSVVLNAITSAVNYLTLSNGATGGTPYIKATGTDTDVNLTLAVQGAGVTKFQDGNFLNILRLEPGVTSAVNYISIANSATGTGPSIGAIGSDTNVDMLLNSKGTGLVKANNNPVLSSVTAVGPVSGTPSSSTYLRGDGQWATVSGAGATPRINSTTSSATPTIDITTTDQYNITALATNITSLSTTGSAADGQKLMVRIKGAAAQTITWNSSNFISSGSTTLLATTVAGKTHISGFVYDSVQGKWVCVAVDAVGY